MLGFTRFLSTYMIYYVQILNCVNIVGAGSVGILPADSKGRHGTGSLKFIKAHSGLIFHQVMSLRPYCLASYYHDCEEYNCYQSQ